MTLLKFRLASVLYLTFLSSSQKTSTFFEKRNSLHSFAPRCGYRIELMHGRLCPILALALVSCATAQPTLQQLLSRVAEEAEVFRQNAPKSLSQETLEQRAVMAPSRFHLRAGAAAVAQPPAYRIQVRQLVSEYSVGALKDSVSGDLVEFRQVISVDGHPVQSAESARHALSLGMQSADDRLRKRMIEEFAKHGLVDIATDYGLILLAFDKRGQANMKLSLGGETHIGAERARGIFWEQTSNAGAELEFRGRTAARRPMHGTLWVREPDGLPLRIEAMAETAEHDHSFRDEATVEYILSTHGFLTPVSVHHRHLVDDRLMTENLYRYEPFRLFSADTEIKFTEIPDPPPPPTKK